MKANRRILYLSLLAAAALLVLTAGARGALAYFTTYTSAGGGYTLTLGQQTTLEEEIYEAAKHVTVSNTGSTPCYVRVRAFAGSAYPLTYTWTDSAWKDGGDGYYYYQSILPAGGKTSELVIGIDALKDASQAKNFNVVVVQEATAVLYDSENRPYADWSVLYAGTATGSEGAAE